MSRDEIDQTINSHILQNTENANIQKLLILTIQLDIDALENLLNEITENHDFDYVLTEILWPFLNKIGILWNTTVISPRHENMVTEILRRKIYAAIDGSCTRNYPKKLTALLFCAENEYNDIPLLSLQYLLQKKGIKAINLGTDLPTEELQYIKHKVDPEIIIMHGTSSSCKNKKIQNTLNKTIQSFPDARIIISGQRKKELDCMELPDNTLIIENVKDIQKSLF